MTRTDLISYLEDNLDFVTLAVVADGLEVDFDTGGLRKILIGCIVQHDSRTVLANVKEQYGYLPGDVG